MVRAAGKPVDPQLDLLAWAGQDVAVVEVAAEPEDAYPATEYIDDLPPRGEAIDDDAPLVMPEPHNAGQHAETPDTAPEPVSTPPSAPAAEPGVLAPEPKRRWQGDTGVAAVDEAQGHMFPELVVATSSLQERLVCPPFSVLDTTQPYWKARRSAWGGLGIQSELGRDDELAYQTRHMGAYQGAGKWVGQQTGTSIFDPVLCELAYRWWCPPEGSVLDPFAGGSVRGVVAGMLGRAYLGIDLREEQVVANRAQWDAIAPDQAAHARVAWSTGDARHVMDLAGSRLFDMVFTCPPYFNLERYSTDPADLSNCSNWDRFCEAYLEIIHNALQLLRPNRFAVFVVGNLRDSSGRLLDLVGETVTAFWDDRVPLYNEGILLNAIGTLPMRTAAQFPKSRKLGKRHQNVLVFYKGNPAHVADHHGVIDGWDPSALVPGHEDG